jgi:hypothetical protein
MVRICTTCDELDKPQEQGKHWWKLLVAWVFMLLLTTFTSQNDGN